MRYILDTNIILHIVRNSPVWQKTKSKYNLGFVENKLFISIVTYAEIKSLARQLHWGQSKIKQLEHVLSSFAILYINNKIAWHYIEIDVYSQGKDKQNPLPNKMSSRNMGKNDLWIAATTKFIQAELITTDNDFIHLNNTFFKVHII
ncbi:MAG: nucleotide-binding protein [Bacteroidetes bacterium]|nr:MAG: nucleotide-binding protein [Bacteroidota bacterium]